MKLPNISTHRLLISLSLGLLVSLLLSLGAYLQAIFINGIMGDAESICDALCATAATNKASFREWLNSFYQWQFFPVSAFVCYTTLKHINLQPIFWSFAIGILIAISLTDTIMIFLNKNNSTLLESYFSNALGSPILAVIFCLILIFIKKISDNIPVGSVISKTSASIFLSFLFTLTVFILVKNFLWLTKSEFSITLNPDFHGTYSVAKEDEARFGVFRNSAKNIAAFHWTGNYSNMELSAEYPNKAADLKLYFFQGCSNKSTKDLVSKLAPPNLALNKIKNFNFAIRDGFGEVSMYSKHVDNGYWSITDNDITTISIIPGEKNERFDLNLLSTGDVELHHDQWLQDMWYRFDNVTADNEGLVPRYYSLNANGILTSYELATDENSPLKKVPQCKQIVTSGEKTSIEHYKITVLLSVTYPESKNFKELNATARTTVKGLKGVFGVKDLAASDLKAYVKEGDLKSMNFIGNFEDVLIDGSLLEKKARRWIHLDEGTIAGSTHGGLVELRGSASSVYVEGERVNKTRWERFSTLLSWVSAIFSTAVGASILFLVKFFMAAWKRNEAISEIDDD